MFFRIAFENFLHATENQYYEEEVIVKSDSQFNVGAKFVLVCDENRYLLCVTHVEEWGKKYHSFLFRNKRYRVRGFRLTKTLAAKCGLTPGDIIVGIDHELLTEKTIMNILHNLFFKVGKVHLNIFRLLKPQI